MAIPNWNGLHLLLPCLRALQVQTFQDFEIIVVDNGSTDGSKEWLASQKQVRIVQNDRNVGFAAAMNQALAAARGQFFVTLNNDTLATPRFLEALLYPLQRMPEVASVSGLLVWQHAPEVIASAGITIHTDGSATDYLLGMPVSAAVDREVFGPSAGAAAYRTNTLRTVGGFDAAYFAYLEDVDLAWRLRLLGNRSWLAASAAVLHAHSATARHLSPMKRFLLSRNRIRVIVRCIPISILVKWWPHIIKYDVLATLEGFIRRDWPRLRGRTAGLLQLPQLIRQRQAIQSIRQVAPEELESFAMPPLPWREALKMHYQPG